MTDDAHSSPQDYVTLTEAAAIYGFNYNAVYKYVFVGRLQATWLEPDQIPASIWQRMDAYAQANVTKKGGYGSQRMPRCKLIWRVANVVGGQSYLFDHTN